MTSKENWLSMQRKRRGKLAWSGATSGKRDRGWIGYRFIGRVKVATVHTGIASAAAAVNEPRKEMRVERKRDLERMFEKSNVKKSQTRAQPHGNAFGSKLPFLLFLSLSLSFFHLLSLSLFLPFLLESKVNFRFEVNSNISTTPWVRRRNTLQEPDADILQYQ